MDDPGPPVDPELLAHASPEVAQALLNKIVVVSDGDELRWARIVEVEAYGEGDPASHAYRGPSDRNAVMFGPPGRLYVYFSYGMHWCANVVTGREGTGQAVLLRAAEPLGGVDAMAAARGGARRRDLCRGPARLAQALGITGNDNGTRLNPPCSPHTRAIWLVDDGVLPPARPAQGPRVGINRAADVPWRWWIAGSPWVSAYRPGASRPRPVRPS